MPRAGGGADKLGNQFEAVWTVESALEVVENEFRSITVEALGEGSIGVEFHLKRDDGVVQFHSVKRQKDGGDWSVADLCRPDKSTNRSVLGDLFDKRSLWPTSEIRFISATGANELRELTERSRTASTFLEFSENLSGKLRREFGRVTTLSSNDPEGAFATLKALEITLRSHVDLNRSVQRRICGLFNRVDGTQLRADDVRRMLAEFFLDNLGREIDKNHLCEFLQNKGFGLQDWKVDRSIGESVARANKRFRTITETELINSTHIVRDVVPRLIDSVLSTESHGALVIAPGGYGKSCVLAQCLAELSNNKVPHLCLKMDTFEPCTTARQLGNQMDLRESPAVVLAGIADNQPSVLVVDQLDAMSLVSGRNPGMWDVFQDLCEEVRSYPRMKMILACREFDLEHDHRLRSLGDPKSRYTKFPLAKLNESEVRTSVEIAGYRKVTLTAKQLDILAIPFHLLLFLQGEPSTGFNTAGELYDRYWNRKQQNLRKVLGREPRWNEVIDALTERMSEQQLLFAPLSVTDNWSSDAQAMASEHVLIEVQNPPRYRFFHESFFDYAYARRFCATGQNLIELLTASEQQLFRRAQVRQILAYRRESDPTGYFADVRSIFASPNVRFHIKRMVATGFNSLDKPKEGEWQAVEPHLFNGELSRYLSNALRDHLGWFDVLDALGVFTKWLASQETRFHDAAIGFLEAHGLHNHRSARIAQLIRPDINRNDEWQSRLLRIFSWGVAHKSEAMTRLFLELIASGAYDDYKSQIGGMDFWGLHYNAEKESPRFVTDVLATWFDRAVMQFDVNETWDFLDACKQNQSRTGALVLCEAAAIEPAYFVEQMLPRSKSVVLKTEVVKHDVVHNRMWPWLSNNCDPYEVNDAILISLRRSLQAIAKQNPVEFRRYAATIQDYSHQTFGYLLLSAWAENPSTFADECARYLIADQRRLNIGYGSWMYDDDDSDATGESAITRLALQAISPHCSTELFRELESKIIGYCDEYEKMTPRRRGYAELLVLRSLDRTRLSTQAKLRIEELERKFPKATDAIVREDATGMGRLVGSPIAHSAAEKMTDSQWISAMQKYDGTTTDWFRGGPRELSNLLAVFARNNRQRFANLLFKMPLDVSPIYFSAILSGLCSLYCNLNGEEKTLEDGNFAAFPTNVLLSVIERLHQLPNRPCGTAIVGCIRRMANRQLPAEVLDVVSHYAINDPDPTSDVWQESVNGSHFYGGNPHGHGINSVRGQAAESIGALLFEDSKRLDGLRHALSALSQDTIISVRTCAIGAFLPLLNYVRDEAVDFFLKACDGCESICATVPFDRFVHHATYSHYGALRGLLSFALNSTNLTAVEVAARNIILADLHDIEVGTDADHVRTGNETMRKAAAHVYARHLSHERVGNACAKHLERFFNDDSEAVRQEVSSGFFHMSGERLLQLQEYIAKYVGSRCLQNETDRLLSALKESNVALPQIICLAANRILEFLGEEGTRVAHGDLLTSSAISTLVVRQYEQTTDTVLKTHCLDLIDRMERLGFFGIAEELAKVDR